MSSYKLGGRREQSLDEMAALLFTSCPCLWVTDPCRREQHRNREHYSEIKVDLELLPRHLAQAAGKSERCRKWMNTQPGWFCITVFMNTCCSRYFLCPFQNISSLHLLLLVLLLHCPIFQHFEYLNKVSHFPALPIIVTCHWRIATKITVQDCTVCR